MSEITGYKLGDRRPGTGGGLFIAYTYVVRMKTEFDNAVIPGCRPPCDQGDIQLLQQCITRKLQRDEVTILSWQWMDEIPHPPGPSM